MQPQTPETSSVRSSQPDTGDAVTSQDPWGPIESGFPVGLVGVILWFLAWFLVQNLITLGRDQQPDWPLFQWDQSVLHTTAFALTSLALLIFWMWIKRAPLWTLGLHLRNARRDLGWFCKAAVVVGLVYLVLAGFALAYLALSTESPVSVFRGQLQASAIDRHDSFNILRVVLIYPVLEEIWYRGLLYTAIRRERGRWFAIILSALIFGYAHGGWFPVNQLLGGVVFAWAFERTRGLLAPTLLHIVGNGSLVVLSLVLEFWPA